MPILNALIPVFLIIALGAVLRRTGFLHREMVQGANALAYWVGLPSLLFQKVSKGGLSLGSHLDALIVLLSGLALAIALGYGLAWIFRSDRRSRGAVVQACFRANIAFIGLAILMYMHSGTDAEDQVMPVAVILLAFLAPLFNVAAVLVLTVGRKPITRKALLGIGFKILTNPLVFSCALGGIYALLFPPLPMPIDRALGALGKMALPLALLGIGATLNLRHLHGNMKLLWAACGIKLLIVPVFIFFLARAMQLSSIETQIVLVFMACPTAAASYILADQLDSDAEFAASSIVMTTLLSFFSLYAALWVAGF